LGKLGGSKLTDWCVKQHRSNQGAKGNGGLKRQGGSWWVLRQKKLAQKLAVRGNKGESRERK